MEAPALVLAGTLPKEERKVTHFLSAFRLCLSTSFFLCSSVSLCICFSVFARQSLRQPACFSPCLLLRPFLGLSVNQTITSVFFLFCLPPRLSASVRVNAFIVCVPIPLRLYPSVRRSIRLPVYLSSRMTHQKIHPSLFYLSVSVALPFCRSCSFVRLCSSVSFFASIRHFFDRRCVFPFEICEFVSFTHAQTCLC